MEQQLLFLINRQWTHPALDLFMAVMSSFALWTPLMVIGIVCAMMFGGFKWRAFVLVTAMLVGVSDGLVSNPLKKYINRPRPHEILANVRQVELRKANPRILAIFKKVRTKLSKIAYERPAQGRSFPSSHTVNIFCVAVSVTAFFGRRGAWFFLVAASVAYSRIYVGSHWPGDVLASMFLGIGTALICLPLFQLLWRQLAGRVAPRFLETNPRLYGGAPA